MRLPFPKAFCGNNKMDFVIPFFDNTNFSVRNEKADVHDYRKLETFKIQEEAQRQM